MTSPSENEIPAQSQGINLPDNFLSLLLQPERAELLGLNGQREQIRIAYVPGVMPGKWFKRWHERFDHICPLLEIPLAEACGLAALTSQAELPSFPKKQEEQDQTVARTSLADMVLLRPEEEPAALDKEKYHAVNLYREKQVVLLPKDHLLTVYEEEVPLAELAQEFMLQEPDTVPGWAEISADYRAQNPQKLPQMRHTQDAVELVAAGLGLLLLPMSVARFYHRRDLTYRIVPELEESSVSLVWKREARTEQRESLIQDFIGICKGRTGQSERGNETRQKSAEKAKKEKERAKQKRQSANARRESRDRKARNARKNGNARQHAAQTKKAGQNRKKR